MDPHNLLKLQGFSRTSTALLKPVLCGHSAPGVPHYTTYSDYHQLLMWALTYSMVYLTLQEKKALKYMPDALS